MGRETKILLGFLGLLAGVFVGVLSMKLLVPRPPAGAGPDIRHEHVALDSGHELVDPPALSPRAWDFAAAPPLVPTATPTTGSGPPADSRSRDTEDARGRFAPVTEPPADLLPPAPPPDMRSEEGDRYAGRRGVDPFAARPSHPAPDQAMDQATELAAPDVALAAAAEPATPEPDLLPPVAARPLALTAAEAPPAVPATVRTASAVAVPSGPVVPATASPRAGQGYTVQSGDSWWSLAETVYGDGRLYRALFAWNRTLDARVTLAPGTRLEIPPAAKLQAAWPGLMPR